MTDLVESTKQRLTFKKSIISTPSNPIGTKDLLTRLQQLTDELAAIDQDNPDTSSINTIKNDLINPKLIKSNNPGVQAYTCCAISDILRLYAPDAPYTANDLSIIFRSFLQQFKKLGDPNNPYFNQQCYLLKRLAEVKSIILITDVKDSEELIELIFNIFYDLSNKEFSTRLQPLVSNILSEIMSEAEIIPHNVLKLILDKLLTNTSSPTAMHSLNVTNPGFNFSVDICEANVDRMSRQVAQYFSEMLYESSSQLEDLSNNKNLVTLKAMENLKKIHKLSIQIWNYIPGLLTSVMGLIDDELNASDEHIRVLATETIGQMIGSSISSQNFIINYNNVWQNWLKKTLDISLLVRCKWVEEIPNIINNLNTTTSEISNELCNGLNKCLIDSEEKVRLISCQSIEKIPFEKFSRFLNKNIMITLNQLIREKHQDIRNESIKILSNHCNKFFNKLINHEIIDFGSKTFDEIKELEEEIFEQIPNQILSLLYINDKDINSQVDIHLFEKILTFESNTTKRVERLIQVSKNLNDKSKKSIIAICKRQQQVSKVLDNFVSLCEQYGKIGSLHDEKENVQTDGKIVNQEDKILTLTNKLDQIIKWLNETIPESYNSITCLERFYKLKNFRYLNLIRLIISSDSDFLTIKNAMKELITKLSNNKNIRLEDDRDNVSSNQMVLTFKLLLYRSSNILYNKSNLIELINYTKKFSTSSSTDNQQDDIKYIIANELLENVSNINPDVFKHQIKNLIDMTSDESNNHYLKSNYLKTIYQLIKKYPNMYPENSEFTNNLVKFCLYGSPREAKYSMKLIGLHQTKKEYLCNELMEKIYPLDVNHKLFTTHLSTICEIFKVDPISVENHVSELNSTLIKEVLLVNNKTEHDMEFDDVNDTNAFIDDYELNNNYEKHRMLYGKLLTIRLFVNRLTAIDEDNKDDQENVTSCEPIMKLLMTIINNGGEIVNDRSTPKIYQLSLRLHAGLSIIKLGKSACYGSMINHDVLQKLVYLVQDQNEKIRSKFLNNLQKNLIRKTINERFLIILYFMNNEPNNEIYFNVATWIKSYYKKTNPIEDPIFEKSFARLIHFLSHDDNFSKSPREQGLKYAADVILFIFNLISKSENVSTLYYVASRVKQFRDATIDGKQYDTVTINHELNDDNEEFPEEIENLYMISELCQLIIKESSDLKNWSILSWPGKILMPNDLFGPMKSTFEAQLIISKIYINTDLQNILKSYVRLHVHAKPMTNSKPKSGSKTKASGLKSKSQGDKSIKPKNKKRKRQEKVKEVVEPSRKSSRTKNAINYQEQLDSDDSELEGSDILED